MKITKLDLPDKLFRENIQSKDIKLILRYMKKYYIDSNTQAYLTCWIELIRRLETLTGKDMTSLLGD